MTKPIEAQWEPARWYSVLDPAGELWCETSDRDEAVGSMRPGDRLFRLWERREFEIREERP